MFAVLLLGFLLTVGCAGVRPLDGVWVSQGYGYVFVIQGPVLTAFEVTTATCVRGFVAKREVRAIPGREATFRARKGGVYFVKSGGTADHKLLNTGSLSDIRIDRVPRLPAVCDRPTPDTPLDNFEVFTRTMAEHYIGFEIRHADWDKMVAENRLKVTAQTSPLQLLEVFESMLKPFGDLHTDIEARHVKHQSPDLFRQGTDRVIRGGVNHFAKAGRRALFAVTDGAYLQGGLRKFCNGQLQYGHVNESTGYLRFLSFGDYAKHGKDAQALESALDAIFSDPKLRALVIDVRLSFGGDDALGLVIASRLASAEYLAYSIEARAHPVEHDKWTEADAIMIRPGSRPAFRGPVVELIGPITMSAAETFTQALMGRSPHVTRIGENTQGVFCDALDRHLPNGWTFALPNAVYRTAEGTAFDVEGIPPDIRVPVFADDDVAAGRDPGMAAAVQILNVRK